MRRVVAALALLLPLLLLPGPAYAAEGDPVTGYWAKTRLGPPVPVDAPTPVPEGGTWVASDPTGPVAVSALRLELAPGTAATALRLEVEELQGEPAIRVCPAVARWRPVQGGPITSAPPHDCKVVVETKVEAGVLTAVLPPGFTIAALDVVLTPEPGSVFSATFKPATAASVTVTSAAPPVVAPPPAPPPPPPGLSSDGTALPPVSSGASFGSPALGAPVVAAPQAAPAPAPVAAPAPSPPPVRALALPAARDDRRVAVPAAALLALLVGFALWLRLQPAAAPRRLGGGTGLRAAPAAGAPGAEQLRGVGRFRDVRTARPVRL